MKTLCWSKSRDELIEKLKAVGWVPLTVTPKGIEIWQRNGVQVQVKEFGRDYRK